MTGRSTTVDTVTGGADPRRSAPPNWVRLRPLWGGIWLVLLAGAVPDAWHLPQPWQRAAALAGLARADGPGPSWPCS